MINQRITGDSWTFFNWQAGSDSACLLDGGYFQSRIDGYVEKFLEHYDLPFFSVELVQAYIEARNAEGEIVISEVVLGMP